MFKWDGVATNVVMSDIIMKSVEDWVLGAEVVRVITAISTIM